jgi:CheY-like chemotaxis protein
VKRILLVEDDASAAPIMKKLLEREGLEVILTDSYESALREFDADSIDLVITDVLLGEKDGVELCNELREIKTNLPVVAVTGMTDDDIIDECGDNPFSLVLSKPFNVKQISEFLAASTQDREDGAEGGSRFIKHKLNGFSIDLESMFEGLGEDEEIVLNFMGIFKEMLPSRIEDIQKAFEAGDYEDMYHKVHTLKGGLSNFYSDELLTLLKETEALIKSHEKEKAMELFADLHQKINILVDYLDEIFFNEG